MTADYNICLGTAGWGVWHSPDAGKSWVPNSRIRALAAHPTEAHTVFAAGDTGVFVSHNGGERWERIVIDGILSTIWSLTNRPPLSRIFYLPARVRPDSIARATADGTGRS
jgi:hypothetical protein